MESTQSLDTDKPQSNVQVRSVQEPVLKHSLPPGPGLVRLLALPSHLPLISWESHRMGVMDTGTAAHFNPGA